MIIAGLVSAEFEVILGTGSGKFGIWLSSLGFECEEFLWFLEEQQNNSSDVATQSATNDSDLEQSSDSESFREFITGTIINVILITVYFTIILLIFCHARRGQRIIRSTMKTARLTSSYEEISSNKLFEV